MIDLTALRDFLVLCQTRSFSRASERCHVSISGLSRRMQGLEQWLGTPVFERHKSALDLTDAGHRLQAVASEVVYALDGVRKSVRESAEDRQSRIRFAAPHVMSAIFFSDWIPRLHNDFPTARFSVDSDNLADCLALLDDGSVDYVAALLDDAGHVAARVGAAGRTRRWRRLVLAEERLIPVSAPNSAGRPMHDLSRPGQALSFLGYAEPCHLGWALQPQLHAWPSLDLRQGHAASLTDGLRFMALSGLGLAWLPESLVRHDVSTRRLVRAGDERFDVPLRLTLFRQNAPMGRQAEDLWVHLSAMAERVDGAIEFTEGLPAA